MTNENPQRLLLESLENRWKKYLGEFNRCHAEFSIEAIHDLRVAARRLLALLRLLNSIDPRLRFKKIVRAIKDQLDEFDELRDTQVILAELSEIMSDLPQLQAFQEHLEVGKKQLLRSLRKKIRKFDISEIRKRMHKVHDVLEKTEGDLDAQMVQAVDDAFLRLEHRHASVDPARPATIHRVRIAFKSFRYMVEIIHPLLKDFPMENLKQMNDYQSMMGEIQDAEVFTQTLADFTRHVSLSDPEPVRRYEEQRHADVLSTYESHMDQFNTFWRLRPDQSFPWEKTGLS